MELRTLYVHRCHMGRRHPSIPLVLADCAAGCRRRASRWPRRWCPSGEVRRRCGALDSVHSEPDNGWAGDSSVESRGPDTLFPSGPLLYPARSTSSRADMWSGRDGDVAGQHLAWPASTVDGAGVLLLPKPVLQTSHGVRSNPYGSQITAVRALRESFRITASGRKCRLRTSSNGRMEQGVQVPLRLERRIANPVLREPRCSYGARSTCGVLRTSTSIRQALGPP